MNNFGVLMIIVNCNTGWVTGRKTKILRDLIWSFKAEIVCCTEITLSFLPDSGYVILSDADYGYSLNVKRRKVALWSKNKWENINSLGSAELPIGRYVSGITESSVGKINVIGVCIPWKDAHVRTGQKNRLPWQDHIQYLSSLQHILQNYQSNTIVIGDFNQKVPRKGSPLSTYNKLMDAFNNHKYLSAGIIPGINKPTIDHIAVSKDIKMLSINGISRNQNGIVLSDHDIIVCDISRNI